jgi:prevent-host-death family protein
MKIAPVAEVKARFSAYIKASVEGPIVVTRHGKPVAVLLSLDDENELERLVLGYSPKFRAILDASRQHIEETGGLEHEEFWRQVEAEAPPEMPE